MTTTHPFNVERAYQFITDLCHPRRVGSPGERQAAQYIHQAFEASGLQVRREPFPVSFFPTEVANRLIFAACALLVLLGAWLVPSLPLAATLCWVVAGLLVNAPWGLRSHVGNYWPDQVMSENLVATPPKKRQEAPARVIFMAHYDTKSQVFPTGIRVVLVTGARAACWLLAGLGLSATVAGRELLPAFGLGLAFAAVAFLLGLIANLTGNRCPGALDNGSGVGALLELARAWRPEPDTPLDVVWVASGSEEAGLDGARAFLERYDAWWEEKPTLLVNLESVGAGRRVYLAGEARALELARGVADRLGLDHAGLHILGAGMDHEPFAARQLTAFSILGDVIGQSLTMHTPRDNMRVIKRPALERAGRLAVAVAQEWADRHQVQGQDRTVEPEVFVQ